MRIKLLDGATATNGVPTEGSGTVGFSLHGLGQVGTGMSHNPPLDGVAALTLASTAGSGTMNCTVRIWLYSNVVSDWCPYGANATAASRGLINVTNSIDEVISDRLRHTELIAGLDNYDRIYAELTAINGTATAIDLWLHGR
jgi:hypothetical protein